MPIRDLFLTFFCVVLTASNIIILKSASSIYSLDIFNTFRFGIFIFFLPFLKKPKEGFLNLFIFGFFNCTLSFILISKAYSIGLLASQVGLISIPRVLAVILLCYFFLKEKISFYQITGLIFSCLLLLFFTIDANTPILTIGMLLLTVSALSYAFATTYFKRKKIKLSLSGLCYANAMSAATMLPYLAMTDQLNTLINVDLSNLKFTASFIYSGIIPIFFATWLWQRLFNRNDAIRLNPIMNLTPFIVLLEAMLFLGEPFSWEFVTFLALMFLSLLMCQNIKIQDLFSTSIQKGRKIFGKCMLKNPF